MDRKTVKIPPTSVLVLESNEDQWRLLVKGIINELKTSALIELASNQSKTVRIKLSIEHIVPPNCIRSEFKTVCRSNGGQKINNGLARITEHLHKIIDDGSWLFVGKILSKKIDVPIVILYYPSINLFLYSQKLSNENLEFFLPNLN